VNTTTESPIERIIAKALDDLKGVEYRTQVEFETIAGLYRTDFIVHDTETPGRCLVVECDGADYHDYDTDRSRDNHLLHSNPELAAVIHLPGTSIYHNTYGCCGIVSAWLRGMDCFGEAAYWANRMSRESFYWGVRARYPLSSLKNTPAQMFTYDNVGHPFSANIYGCNAVVEFGNLNAWHDTIDQKGSV